jgi:putative hydrolase of the HAD superfamily
VFFDAVFTLIRPDPPSPAVYAAVAAEHGIIADATALGRALKRRWIAQRERKRVVTIQHGTSEEFEKRWWRDLVRGAFGDALGEPCSDACFEAIFARYGTRDVWALVPGARETLAALRERGVTTGVISNYDARLGSVLTAHGLAPLLDVVAYSSEVGWEKPDAPIFHAAAARAGCAPAECMHVGDDVDADVRGALSAGMRALWFIGGGSSAQPDDTELASAPAPVIRELDEVVWWVDERRRAGVSSVPDGAA